MNTLKTILSNLASGGDDTRLIEVHGTSLENTSAQDLYRAVGSFRQFLVSCGVQPGDRVALLSPNSAMWVAADLAILSQGAICVPLYARQNPVELANMMRDCKPTVLLIANEDLESGIRKAWDNPCRLALFSEALAHAPTEEAPHAVQGEDIVTIIYTSGTSGEPKGVMLSANNVDFMVPTTVRDLNALMDTQRKEDHVFHYLPFCFAGSRIMLWTQLFRANPLMMSTDLNNLAEEIGTANPSYYLNVPALLERIRKGVTDKVHDKGGIAVTLFERGFQAYTRIATGNRKLGDKLALAVAKKVVYSKIKEKIGSRLQFLVCGSAPLSEDTQRWFEMIGIPVYQVYGLTETTAIVTMDKPQEIVAGRVGPVIQDCGVMISDEGELLCQGPNIFAGYWGRDGSPCDSDGWFHTGDQAEIDDAGNIRIIGRVRNVLVPESGHNVAPEPLEQRVMEACHSVEQAVLVGHGRPYLSIIVTGDIKTDAMEEALESVNASLPHYRRIRRFHIASTLFTPENKQLTANQKLRRKQIEADYEEAIEEMYA